VKSLATSGGTDGAGEGKDGKRKSSELIYALEFILITILRKLEEGGGGGSRGQAPWWRRTSTLTV
jgi:hypothetical protein